ncbi:predicted protein [Nematostella vectensis]|uniref:Uncharacterized protein n=1 Tax=Nematostella vectensis TaxID=45351 RepID=A7S0V8_NEMVE|nr:predicted protein [Nematostella vectensis]|eukprot:XP_001634710.1 predicted protein [Nematostella vectensis]
MTSHTTTTQHTVVTVQPGTTTYTIGQQRDWSSGLFECTKDIGGCLVTFLCPCVTLCQISQRMGEGLAYGCCCADIAAFTLRAKLRTEQNIQGSLCNDAIHVSCCMHCALCQMSRELDHVGK